MADTSAFRLASEPTITSRNGTTTESLIDRESHFSGTYRTPDNLRIEGRYEGEIACTGTVFIGETATVNARIAAGNVTIAGQFDGEIVCESRFEVLRTGRVSGSVNATITVVHEGAFYQGELRMTRVGASEQGRQSASGPRPVVTPPVADASPAGPSRPPVTATERPIPAAGRRRLDPAASTGESEIPMSLAATAAGPRASANGTPNGRASALNAETQPLQDAE